MAPVAGDTTAELRPEHIILATGPEAIQAAKNATKTIPIVMVFSGDPVEGES